MKTDRMLIGLTKRVLMLVVALFAIVAAGQVANSAAAQPDDPLPAPTGRHKTGRMSFHWKEATRDELETRAPEDKRELMVHLFYPADPNVAGARAPYVPDADAMRGPWNNEQAECINKMRAFSRENAALPSGNARYPVVVFAPGGGMKGLTYHTLLEDLASHGWVVAAIDPPYNARAVRFPDGRVLGNLQPAERGWPATRSREEERRFYQERIVHWSRDVSFVINQLTALDQGNGRWIGGTADLMIRGMCACGDALKSPNVFLFYETPVTCRIALRVRQRHQRNCRQRRLGKHHHGRTDRTDGGLACVPPPITILHSHEDNRSRPRLVLLCGLLNSRWLC